MFYKEVGHSQEGAKEVTKLLDNGAFDGPKPVRLLNRLLTLANLQENSVIMDFFSGSATTAHAVIQNNAEKNEHKKFILMQLPEPCDEKGTAYKAGYHNICEIGEDRIRRAGKKIKEESPLTTEDLDIGFRVFHLDSTNMQDAYYRPANFEQGQLELFADNIKPDRTPEDLLFQVMIDLGILLSSEIEDIEIAGKKSVLCGWWVSSCLL